jgi:hypothetical protein
MKNSLHHVIASMTLGWFVFTNAAASAGSVTRRGPDSLHYLVRNNVTPTGSGAQTINGTFQLHFIERGEKVQENLTLRVAGMETNATVSLTAAVGDDPANVITVAHLPTDKKGRLRQTFITKSPAPARPSRVPPVPESLSPLTDVGAICFEDSTGQVVGNAGVQDATHFQYVVRRNLTPANDAGTEAGSISLTASERRTSLTLVAGGLTPNTDYMLALNGSAVATVTSDKNGYLRVRGWPDGSPPVLTLRSLALTDSGGSVLLSTTLPR